MHKSTSSSYLYDFLFSRLLSFTQALEVTKRIAGQIILCVTAKASILMKVYDICYEKSTIRDQLILKF